MVDTTEQCYLVFEEGYLTCSFNHKIGDECLMHKANPQEKPNERTKELPDLP